MRWRIWTMAACLTLAGCGAFEEATPSFQAKFSKGQLDDEFGEFVDKHEGQTVKLDLQWEPGAFLGGSESDFQFFVIFESCAEPLEKGEAPAIGNCNGTEYNVPKRNGKPVLTQEGGRWRMRGTFTPGERTGPRQGLFSVPLEPAS